MLSSRSEVKNLTSKILSNFSTENFNQIPENCNALIKHLFSNQYLLFTDLNYLFENNGLISMLITTMEKVQESLKRDILRLIHLLLQVNKSLRNEVRKSTIFQKFLFKILDQSECWENRVRYKHHINIASQLLVDKEFESISFNTKSVRRFVRSTIIDLISKNIIENDDVMPCIIFYGCSMSTSKFENIPRIPEDLLFSEKVLTKEITGRMFDYMRDYIHDFKKFYEDEKEQERTHFVLYKPKSEYSFMQICKTLIYYCIQNEGIRMNIFQCGLYSLVNSFLTIKSTPEELLLYIFDILKLAPMDTAIFKGVKDSYSKSFESKLKNILNRQTISEETTECIHYLFDIYDIPYDKNICSNSSNMTERCKNDNVVLSMERPKDENIKLGSSTFYGFENWDALEVQEWFDKNNLSEIKNIFCHLTGNGLEQLQILLKKSEKMNFVIFLMEKVKLPFDITLELISALEKL